MLGELVKAAMRRDKYPRASVVPILLRPVDDWQEQPFGGLIQLPRNGRFISTLNKDVALAEVAREIRKLVEQVWETIA